MAGGAAVAGGGEDTLEPLPDDGVEERPFGLPPSVAAEGRADGVWAALPGLDGRGGRVHAGPLLTAPAGADDPSGAFRP